MIANLAGLLFCALPSAPVADLYVDQSAASCATGTGTAADPVCSIAAAIALASPGDTIRIAPGTYFENLTVPMDLDLVGTGGADVTIVDGGDGPGHPGARVFTIPAAVSVTMDGLTITNGWSATDAGAGIRVEGALYISNSTIAHNATPMDGGGFYGAFGSEITLENCVVRNNVAYDSFGYSSRGGGGFVNAADLTILGSTFSENHVPAYTGSCGFAGFGGGGLSFRATSADGVLTIADSTFSDNRATCDGGGIVIVGSASQAVITNTTLSGNVAEYGAGMLASSFVLENVTITGNHSASSYYGYAYMGSGACGGLISYGPAGEHVVHNSVIAGNTRLRTGPMPTIEPLDGWRELSSQGSTVIGTWDFGSGLVDGVNGDRVVTDPGVVAGLLGPLRDNGGPTETHAPLLGSLLLDGGDLASFEPFDQRGRPRPFGGAPDIGAVEFAPLADLSRCNGDGGDQLGCTNCPCGNDAPLGSFGGCLNSSGSGATLDVSGSASVSLPPSITSDLRFALTGAPTNALCVLVSGSALAPDNPANPCFVLGSGVQSALFDGLRCATGLFRRHGARSSDASGAVGATNAPWGGESDPQVGIAQAFGGFAAGETRFFQVVHRDAPSAVCMRGLNTSQALEIVFVP